MLAINTKNLTKISHIFLEKPICLYIVYSKCGHEYEKNI